MASGVCVAASVVACGKSSEGVRQKRKIASGLPNVRKKPFNVKDVVKTEVEKCSVYNKTSPTKRKERFDDEDTDDSSLELDAAKALTEFCLLANGPSFPSFASKVTDINKQSLPPLPQWSRKKRRSGRLKRADSTDGSQTVAFSREPVQQQSDCSSSAGKDSQSAVTTVKAEQPCGSVEQRCSSDRNQNKLVSDSSNEFPQLESQAESPTSPLPSLRMEEVGSVGGFTKFEDGGRSAFQRVVPIRPVKKPAVGRKLKVEEIFYEAANSEQAAVKLVTRKKPRPTGVSQVPAVKVEDVDAGWAPTAPEVPASEGMTKGEEAIRANPCEAAAEEVAAPEPVPIKVESKPSGPAKPGQRSTGKLKPAISESEKEARRQRRVQANRESARQTIRRKQVLCEDLSQKSQHLAAENDRMKQDLDLLAQKLSSLKDMNVHLKDQLALSAAKREPGAASPEPAPSSSEKPSGVSAFKYQPLLPVSFGGMQMPQMPQIPHPFYWLAFSQATAKMQSADLAMGFGGDYSSLASIGNIPPGYWMGISQAGSQGGQANVMPPYFAFSSGLSSANIFNPSSRTEASNMVTPSTPMVPSSVSQPDGSFSLVNSGRDRGPASHKSYGVKTFVDTSHVPHDTRPIAAKCDTSCQGSGFGNKGHYFKLPPSSQSGVSPALGGIILRRTASEEVSRMSVAPTQLLRGSSGNLGAHTSKMANSRYSMYTNGGRRYPEMGQDVPIMMAAPKPSEAVAAAAEARRRRRELTRSRSLHYRQNTRVAEPPVS